MLKQRYFPIVGSVPKHFTAKNRRHMDFNVAMFEAETEKSVDRQAWGLPKPNLEASYISLAKYAKDVPNLSPKQVDRMNKAFSFTERQFAPYMSDSRVKELDEVVAGLDKSTSPGFPWVKTYKTKRDMIDNWKDFDQYMQEDWERLKDPLWTAVFGNSLKEEVRPAEKIAQNSIRTFTAGPIEATIHGNRLFEDMNQKFYASHLRSASVVGFSPLKGGWNELYNKLRKFPMGFALDESQYDSSLRSYMMWSCAEFRWKMLREEDQTEDNLKRLLTYYRNLINTVILTSEGVLVMKLGGNPSGSVNTISDNTLILYTLLAFAWLMIAPEGMDSYEAFEAHTSKALVGDDNTFTVSPEAINFFNAHNIIPVWKDIGITTTTDCMEPRPVEELDFLSAHTVVIDGCAVPLMDRNKILTSLLYSRYPDDPAYTLTRVTAMQRVAWADVPMRRYLQEFVSWMIKEYDPVLCQDPEWVRARTQIPTSLELRELFLGKERSFGMIAQSVKTGNTPPEKALMCRCDGNGRIKTLIHTIKVSSNQLVIPSTTLEMQQRPKRQRQPKKGGKAQPQYKVTQVQRMNNPRVNQKKVKKGKARRGNRQQGMGNMFPSGFASRGRRTCTITEDEYIADVDGTVAFTTTQYPINPGQAGTFPWLSKEALLWEKYRFKALEFYYKPQVSAFATNGQSGKVMLSCDYDASDAPPTSKQMVEDTHPHMDAMPYNTVRLRLEPKEMYNTSDAKYVRPGGLPGSSDIKTYDCGNLYISTDGNTNTSVIGELRVRYSVTFDVPILETTAAAPTNNQVAFFQSAAPQTLADSTPTALALATASNNGILAVNTAGSIVLPAGNYLVDGGCEFRDTTVELVNTSLYITVAGTSIFVTNPFNVIGSSLGANEEFSMTCSGYVSVNGTQAIELVADMAGATGPLTGAGYLRIVAI
jgi:hypothetical protein